MIYGVDKQDYGVDIAIGVASGDSLSGIAKQECYVDQAEEPVSSNTSRNLQSRRTRKRKNLSNLPKSL